jgi:catechol 2,3-dioxygenase-like lactoylglutathione lyase family enzyme
MDHVGIVVNDLPAAVEFFVGLGLEVEGEATIEDEAASRIVGLEGVRSEIAMLRSPDGRRVVELVKFNSPASPEGEDQEPAHLPGIRHLAFVVEDVESLLDRLRSRGSELVGELVSYGGYKLCYVRGPEGIIVELAEETR